MTTPPPTADGSAPATADGSAPAWLPDEETLSRLAGEFFRALPGQPTDMDMDMAAPVPDGHPQGLPGQSEWPAPTGLPVQSEWPVPTGLPAADPPPPAPTAGMSPPSGPPPTSAPATFAASAPGLAGPAPEVPAPPVAPGPPPVAPSSAPARLVDPGAYYFLTEAPGYPAQPPELPGFGHLGLPPLPPLFEPEPPTAAATTAPYYFLQGPGVPGVSEAPGSPVGLLLDPHPAFDVRAVRRDFPILSELVNGRPLIWLDNAATTQKPQAVIDRLVEFYSRENSNIHRAAHELAARATDAYEGARKTVARFVGAGSAEEIVFVRGTTEAINLVAKAWGPGHLRAGDEIVLSHLEHHANIVPWQMLAQQTGAVIKVIPVDDDGQVLLDEYTKLLSDRTRLVAVTQLSNALGTVVPVEQIIEIGHRAGARVLVDAAQSVPHLTVDVTALDADFLVFSGHKLFGPTGIGVLYAKREILEDMPPWEGGGNMITDVTFERSGYQPPPGRFEAGTGNIADAVGLAAAIDYVERIGLPNIAAYEHTLLEHATEGLRGVPGLRLIGTAPDKASIASFVLDGYEPAEVGTALNEEGIAVRSGHHCAQPILRRYGLEATVRPSFAFYNTHEEVDTLITAVHRLATRRGGHH
ncbi:family 2A encapsulin nanocompartment cargo protein cysteine desulfurase [Streptomyces pseudovenezuelae]|uniref:cysteine desulfurase n=1 Tax=Streptomyces pseudovenezuelae TaxID=67350 RepID=A0ABT6LT24_9ACTN|nr:family 2A encapsulin nanocompartment cargo protein cysteine desulfurase [Streptomyces pseudovenezuelae]MDH6219467.1 cysteine desulfurase/selenocysteine lyase [Streptomyces pseudovenezuelae]